jgi:hypothetical protein
MIYEFRFQQHQLRGDWQGARQIATKARTALPDIPYSYAREIEACTQLRDFRAAREALSRGRAACPPPDFPWGKVEGEINEAELQARPTTIPAP